MPEDTLDSTIKQQATPLRDTVLSKISDAVWRQ